MTKIDTEMNVWIIFCRCEGGDNTYVRHCSKTSLQSESEEIDLGEQYTSGMII